MKRIFTPVGIGLLALFVVGAACQKKATTTNTTVTTNTVQNTNTDATTNTSGSFTTTNSSTNSSSGETVLVTISDSGMDQKNLAINSGTTVTFKNDDTVTHQIASDPHPSHSDLPEFDGLIAAGAAYRFTFTKKGSWGYHDHLRAADSTFQGTVVVQ